jgi:protein-S-isoprenylcysteine O-methyltransferase Ste14
MYAGIAILVGSVWALVLLIPLTLFISNVVIRREEAYLLRAFGEEYARYKMHVRRWV